MDLARQTVTLIERDIEMFEKYGYTRTDLDLYREKIKQGEELDLKIDKERAAIIKEQRNKLMDTIVLLLNDLDLTLRLKYGLKSKEYNLYNLHRFKYLTGKDLYQRVAVILDLRNSSYSELLNQCISPAKQEELAQHNQELGRLQMTLENTLNGKVLNNQLHVETSNELYAETLKIRKIGKQMWALSNYVLSKMYAMPKRRKKRKKAKDKLKKTNTKSKQ